MNSGGKNEMDTKSKIKERNSKQTARHSYKEKYSYDKIEQDNRNKDRKQTRKNKSNSSSKKKGSVSKDFKEDKEMKKMNKKGSMMGLLLGLIMGVVVVMILIMFIPSLTEMLDTAQNSQGLNCVGYIDTVMADGNYSYNASIGQKSSMACMGIKMYLPLLILIVLIGVITKILYDKGTDQYSSPY